MVRGLHLRRVGLALLLALLGGCSLLPQEPQRPQAPLIARSAQPSSQRRKFFLSHFFFSVRRIYFLRFGQN